MTAPSDRVDRLVAQLAASTKYQGLCPDMLRWAARRAASQHDSEKRALKAAKRQLHQAFGAFVDGARRKAALQALEEAAQHSGEAWREALQRALSLHASTAERLDHLPELWARVQAHAPRATRILDLGCGLTPAALPWSTWPADIAYLGLDLDHGLCAALTSALRPVYEHVRVEPAEIRAHPLPDADLVLLWKQLPTLERQDAGSAAALVDRLDAPVLAATFPTRSLGGRDRGMARQYEALAERVMGPGTAEIVGQELLYVVRR